jgi:hypothetical protein
MDITWVITIILFLIIISGVIENILFKKWEKDTVRSINKIFDDALKIVIAFISFNWLFGKNEKDNDNNDSI